MNLKTTSSRQRACPMSPASPLRPAAPTGGWAARRRLTRPAGRLIGTIRMAVVLLASGATLRADLQTPPAAAGGGVSRNVAVEYGADPTGKTYSTAAIQRAIDACNPGDEVLIPPGTYVMNSGLMLKSDLTVVLARGAVVQANTANVWVVNGSPLFHAVDARHVTITGGGTIDGGGLVYPRGKYALPRPGSGVRFDRCTDMTIRDVTVRNIPAFSVDYNGSSHITADGVTIRGRGFANLKGSSDGMDVENSSDVTVTRCDIEVGDDALCIKSDRVDGPTHDITARDCTLASTCNCFKIGTNTVGEVYNVVADGIVVNKHSNPGKGNPVPTGDCISAICIESNDHNRVHDVVCRNFKITSCYCPIYVELQNRQLKGRGAIGRLDHVLIENVDCLRSVAQPVLFDWQDGGANKIQHVTLAHVTVHNYGTKAGETPTPMTGRYPDAHNNGLADAYGVWARGVDGLTMTGCEFYNEGGSRRAKVVFDPSVEHVTSLGTDR